eukprot:TRINITY_DN19741_c0_g1_i6.p1 TRINITY_DN19741_c0_g1~~TRINITY_DN19741_c0_g1_i6.p1  ORF type:complete len:175 (+),score=26.60 TRINITY_DN19741_c0_g1_i6:189-713(+)
MSRTTKRARPSTPDAPLKAPADSAGPLPLNGYGAMGKLKFLASDGPELGLARSLSDEFRVYFMSPDPVQKQPTDDLLLSDSSGLSPRERDSVCLAAEDAALMASPRADLASSTSCPAFHLLGAEDKLAVMSMELDEQDLCLDLNPFDPSSQIFGELENIPEIGSRKRRLTATPC